MSAMFPARQTYTRRSTSAACGWRQPQHPAERRLGLSDAQRQLHCFTPLAAPRVAGCKTRDLLHLPLRIYLSVHSEFSSVLIQLLDVVFGPRRT